VRVNAGISRYSLRTRSRRRSRHPPCASRCMAENPFAPICPIAVARALHDHWGNSSSRRKRAALL
jgi:hypothetical protein